MLQTFTDWKSSMGFGPNSEKSPRTRFRFLGELDLSDPIHHRLSLFWLYRIHRGGPPGVSRHNYDPWSKGKSPKYVK